MSRLLPLLLLLGACPKANDTGQSPVEIGDPVERLDTYGGSAFAELLEVQTWGDLIVFCSGVQGLNVYDAADPEDLTLVDRVSFVNSSNSYPRCQHLSVDEEGERIYVAAHADRMAPTPWIETFDASDPGRLTRLWDSQFDENLEGIEVMGDLLLAAAHSSGLLVFNREADGSLTEVGRLSGLSNPWVVKAGTDGIAYVADGTAGLAVVDVSDPVSPTLVTTVDLGGTAKHLDIDGDRLFAALGSAGAALVSLADPRAPVLIEVEDTPGSAVSVGYGAATGALYVSDWNDLRVFDLSEDRNDLVLKGREPLNFGAGAQTRSLGLAARDDILFSSNWTEMVSYRYHPERSAPDLVISPQQLGLLDTEQDETTFDFITLRNDGTLPLSLTGWDGDRTIEVIDLPEALAPGERASVRVEWTPNDSFAFSGEIEIQSNDPDQAEQIIGVFGNGGGLTLGDTAPDFVFPTLDGGEIDLADHDGPVMLAYFATF